MAKINITFNGTTYAIDEAALESATAALKTHLSSTMAGSGATIKLGNYSYNIDATKLATARDNFITHLGTISGSGEKITINGIEYDIDSAKISSAIADMGAAFRELENGGGSGGKVISGSAVSWNASDDAVYLLYPATTDDATIKAEWNMETPVYTALRTAIKGSITDVTVDSKAMKSQDFTFGGVVEGSYKLAILKPGKYVPKIVEITVGNEDVNVGQQKLWLYGDVNYDGKVNNKDLLEVKGYLDDPSSWFGSADEQTEADRMLAADVNADGLVDETDRAEIEMYKNGKPSVFDQMK